jgi:hypothetical protein
MRTLVNLVCLASLTAAGLLAQTVQISGVVRDAGGLAVAGTEITLTQTDTGLVRTTWNRLRVK